MYIQISLVFNVNMKYLSVLMIYCFSCLVYVYVFIGRDELEYRIVNYMNFVYQL
jgi:hypothetical protein